MERASVCYGKATLPFSWHWVRFYLLGAKRRVVRGQNWLWSLETEGQNQKRVSKCHQQRDSFDYYDSVEHFLFQVTSVLIMIFEMLIGCTNFTRTFTELLMNFLMKLVAGYSDINVTDIAEGCWYSFIMELKTFDITRPLAAYLNGTGR